MKPIKAWDIEEYLRAWMLVSFVLILHPATSTLGVVLMLLCITVPFVMGLLLLIFGPVGLLLPPLLGILALVGWLIG